MNNAYIKIIKQKNQANFDILAMVIAIISYGQNKAK